MKPTAATAITATTVAIVPSKVPDNQLTADTSTPEPCGSAKLSCAEAGAASKVEMTAASAAARMPFDIEGWSPPGRFGWPIVRQQNAFANRGFGSKFRGLIGILPYRSALRNGRSGVGIVG